MHKTAQYKWRTAWKIPHHLVPLLWSWCSDGEDEDWWRQTRGIKEPFWRPKPRIPIHLVSVQRKQWILNGMGRLKIRNTVCNRAQEGTKRHRGKGAHGLGIWHVATGMYNGASGATGWEAAPHRVAGRDYFMSWTRAQGWAFTHLQRHRPLHQTVEQPWDTLYE